MPVAGDDLREYLIVPPACSASSSESLSGPGISANHTLDSRPDTPRFHKSANNKAERSNMEVDYQLRPALLASSHVADAAVTMPLEGVMSLDDFLTTHQAEHDAHTAVRGAAQPPPAKKSKPSNNSAPQPIAVGVRSSKYTILLHEKYQALAIPQPVFNFEVDSATRWAVEVSFPGLDNAEELQGLKEEGRFNSKQEGKEAASRTALAILERLVEEGRVTKAGKAKKPKGKSTQQEPKEKEEPGENFVGQLLEFQRATSGPQPTYTDYQLGTRWACLLELEGHDEPFSSRDALFGSKKAARQHAAGRAIAYFKAEGLWPDEFSDVGGIKKRKPTAVTPSSISADGRHVNAASVTTSSAASATSQVAALAQLLSLNTPEYRFEHANPLVPNIHTVSCYFKNGGAHEGPIGEVRNVFGKKKAKEECARLVLGYLNETKRQREDFAARLVASITGGAGVASVGVEMAMDEEESITKRMAGFKHASDDEFDIYEDAMEH